MSRGPGTGVAGRSWRPWRLQRPVRRILVIRRKALGDALVTLPAVLRLAEAFPAARVDLVVDRPFAGLLAELSERVRVLVWPPERGGAVGWLRSLRAGAYDLVIDYLGSPRTAFWTAVTGAPLRVGYDLPGRRHAYNVRVPRNRAGGTPLRQYAGEAFLDPLRALGLDPAPWSPAGPGASPAAGSPRPLGAAYLAWAREWERRSAPRIALVLSASWPAKEWPAEHAGALTARLRGEGAAPLLVPGPGDEPFAGAVRAADPLLETAPPTTLPELADLLRRCQLFVGTDNGVRHLAVLLGLPTVTLFGPTDPLGWNPADPRHVSVRTGEPCSPCDLTICPVPGHPCLASLGPDRVLAGIRRVLAPQGPAPDASGPERPREELSS
ncbi:MAG: glycosyltransferase family 9 protein [Candidatus Krumholzibacteriia bacterium]